MILSCGEALIDMLPFQTADGLDGFVPHAGGAIFNTAVALGRLGIPAGLFASLSTDNFSEVLIGGLQESHVSTAHILRKDLPSTLAFVHLSDGHATYSFFDENSAGRMLLPADLPETLEDIDCLFFGGISLVSEPAADAYAELLIRESDDKLIMLDPNIRPDFIQNESGYRDRLDRVIARSDIVKISDEDLNWLIPSDDALETKARKVLDAGPQMLLLTRGGAGATALARDGRFLSVPAQPVKVADTVGAGDTFNAGFLAELYQRGLSNKKGIQTISDEDLNACLSFAARVAGVTVTRAGANPPWRSEL